MSEVARFLQRAARAVWWTVTFRLPARLRERRARIEARKTSYDEWVRRYDTPSEEDMAAMRMVARAIENGPLVSILMPVFDPPERFLREAIESVRAQVYGRWELCVANDASTEAHVRPILDESAALDDRIRVVHREERGGIAAASNSALEIARGPLIGLLDHDDVLPRHALLLMVRLFAERPELVFAYSDEDKIDESGRRFSPHFKPDWNPTLLLSLNYVSHFSVFRADAAREVGGFRSELDGSQDWDLFLRLTERLPETAIGHVPHVLYHWRAAPGSAAEQEDAKPYAIEAGRRAVEDHVRRRGRDVVLVPVGVHQSPRYPIRGPHPLVSALVVPAGTLRALWPWVEGLLSRTDYGALEVAVVVSADPTAVLPDQVRVLVRSDPTPASAAALNWAAPRVPSDVLLFLAEGTEVVEAQWLETMVGHLLQERVGAVGALIVDSDDSIRHAGLLLGAGEVADPLYRGSPLGTAGHANRARLPQDLSAVAGECMLVRRDAFLEVGGFDETLPAYGDVDLCLKLRRAGWRVVFVPDAIVRSDASELDRESPEAAGLMHERWGEALRDDPMHNPNFELDAVNPSRLAFSPRVSYPWRLTTET